MPPQNAHMERKRNELEKNNTLRRPTAVQTVLHKYDYAELMKTQTTF